MNWLLYSLISSAAFGLESTISYDLVEVEKLGSAALNTVIHTIFVAVGLSLAMITKKNNILKDFTKILTNYSVWIILAGICGLFGNVFLYWAYVLGDDVNPGIIATMSNVAIVISTLLAYLVYDAKITGKQGLGMLVMIIAFGMASMSNSSKDSSKIVGKKHQGKNSGSTSASNKKTAHPQQQQQQVQVGQMGQVAHHQGISGNVKKKNKVENYKWIIVTLLSALAYGGLSFFQYVITKKDKKLNMLALGLGVALIESIIGIIIYCISRINKGIEKGPFKNYKKDIETLLKPEYYLYNIGAALCDGLGLSALLKSYTLAKNPGISDVISDSYTILQSILAYIIYGKSMDVIQGLSILVAIGGAALISLK